MKKIDINKSTVRKFNSRYDLSNGMLDLGQQGYFSDTEDFAEYEHGTLIEVMGNVNARTYPFVKDGNISDSCFKYFIPANLVVFKEEPKEKKYRPFMYLDELPFNIGDVVIYRGKQCCSECKGIVTEIEYQNNDDCELDNIIIGGINGTPQELFDHYELLDDNCQYRPFGVEE